MLKMCPLLLFQITSEIITSKLYLEIQSYDFLKTAEPLLGNNDSSVSVELIREISGVREGFLCLVIHLCCGRQICLIIFFFLNT